MTNTELGDPQRFGIACAVYGIADSYDRPEIADICTIYGIEHDTNVSYEDNVGRCAEAAAKLLPENMLDELRESGV